MPPNPPGAGKEEEGEGRGGVGGREGEEGRHTSAHVVHALLAELVVGGALLLVGEHRVSLGDGLELLLGRLVVLVVVGVVLHSQLAVRFLRGIRRSRGWAERKGSRRALISS